MKNSILFTVIVLIAIGAAAFMWWPNMNDQTGDAPAPAGKLMAVEDYVRMNISELSPVKEELGGKFFVTEISVDNGAGVVSYEDGHNAYTADFTYASSDLTGHEITSFVIRQ